MNSYQDFYQNTLYPLQDNIFRISRNFPFYLTGGTALSRFYLNHRYSDDLDFFVNNHPKFKENAEAFIREIKKKYKVEIGTTANDFIRCFIHNKQIIIKVDFINDIECYYGEIQLLNNNKIDNPMNILSNKICALSRYEIKDVIDILFIAYKYSFNWRQILNVAKEKDIWVNELDVAKIISETPGNLLKNIKWISRPSNRKCMEDFETLAVDIVNRKNNSLNKEKD